MEIRLYLQMLKRGWWIIILTILVALVTALAVSYWASPRYRAIARFIVTPGVSDRNQVLDSLSILDSQIITTYAEVMQSERIYAETLAELQLQPADLKDYSYKAVVVSDTSVLELTVSGPNPRMVALIANVMGVKTIEFIEQLNQVYNFDFMDVPLQPEQPYFPDPLLNGALAILLGLIGGIILVVINEQFRVQFETIRKRFHYDAITGVFTKKFFTQGVADEMAQHPQGVFSVGIIELEGIRDLVDALPIVSLQTTLQRITEILHREVRGNDMVARWNEYSFSLLFPNTPAPAARRILERIAQALREPFELDQLGISVDFDPTVGGAEYKSGMSTQQLYEKADLALDQARRDSLKAVHIWESQAPHTSQPAADATHI